MIGMDREILIRSLRLSLTCILLFILTRHYQVPESAWALITVQFVMFEYSTVGGVLTKSLLRFTGTCVSALYGLLIIYFCGNNPVINILALLPGFLLYGYFFMSSDKTYIGTIGSMTLLIVLLNYNNIDVAVLRVFNVIIGILGSMFMIRFFYPQYARNKLIELQVTFLVEFASLLKKYGDTANRMEQIETEYLIYESRMLQNFVLFQRYLGEAKIETKKAPEFIASSREVMTHFRRLFRLFSVFIYFLSTPQIRTDPWVQDQFNDILQNLQNLQNKLLYRPLIPMIELNTAAMLPPEPLQPENKIATEAIINSMRKELQLLDAGVDNVIKIYSVYPVEVHAEPAT
jgi:hypothetical protein